MVNRWISPRQRQRKTGEVKSNQMDKEIKRLNKVVDMLEQRISTLEKVSESHAKCIGQLRENKQVKWKWNYT